MIWLLIAGWLAGWLLLWRVPVLSRAVATPRSHRVSVVVPARNEADRLPRLLRSIERQCRPADQVIVVDDNSTDATQTVAQGFAGVEVIAAQELPHGWSGKSWACAAGAARAEGDVLVFLDADVEMADDALSALLEHWEGSAADGSPRVPSARPRRRDATSPSNGSCGLLSVQPHHRIGRPVETLSLIFNVVAVMGLGIGSLPRARRQWGAAGPCMVTARETYESIGGHSAVRGEVAEDLALASRYLSAGLPVRCVGGGGLIRFRMYRNARSLFEGWSKNIATGAGRTPALRACSIALWITALLCAIQYLLLVPGESSVHAAAAGAGVYAAVTIQVFVLGRQVGKFGPAALLWPLLVAFFTAVFVWSAVRTVLVRQVRWSGRTLRLGPHH